MLNRMDMDRIWWITLECCGEYKTRRKKKKEKTCGNDNYSIITDAQILVSQMTCWIWFVSFRFSAIVIDFDGILLPAKKAALLMRKHRFIRSFSAVFFCTNGMCSNDRTFLFNLVFFFHLWLDWRSKFNESDYNAIIVWNNWTLTLLNEKKTQQTAGHSIAMRTNITIGFMTTQSTALCILQYFVCSSSMTEK